MNLQDKLMLGLIFFTVLFNTSCKTENNIGIPKEPQDNIGALFHDTVTIESSVHWADSISSDFTLSTPYLMLGEYQDDFFGKLTAECYTSLFLEPARNFATAPVLDSAVISLWPYITQDSIREYNSQKIQVYEIDDAHNWNKNQKYFVSSEPLPLKNQDLTSGNFDLFNVFDQQNKIISRSYKARLNNDFGNKLLSLMQLSNEDLLNIFPGIAIKAEGNKKMFSLRNLSADTANSITLYYKDVNGRAGRQKLIFGSDSTGFYRISQNWSSTNLSSLNINNRTISTNDTKNLCYIQTGIGIYTKVTFPYIQSLKRGRNILVNKAELIIKCADTDMYPYVYRPFISVFENSIDNKNLLPLSIARVNNTNINIFYASYDNTQGVKGYKLDITNYIQKLLLLDVKGSSLYLGGSKSRIGSGTNPPYSNFLIDRAVFYDNKLSGGITNSDRMRLNLYYTVVD